MLLWIFLFWIFNVVVVDAWYRYVTNKTLKWSSNISNMFSNLCELPVILISWCESWKNIDRFLLWCAFLFINLHMENFNSLDIFESKVHTNSLRRRFWEVIFPYIEPLLLIMDLYMDIISFMNQCLYFLTSTSYLHFHSLIMLHTLKVSIGICWNFLHSMHVLSTRFQKFWSNPFPWLYLNKFIHLSHNLGYMP